MELHSEIPPKSNQESQGRDTDSATMAFEGLRRNLLEGSFSREQLRSDAEVLKQIKSRIKPRAGDTSDLDDLGVYLRDIGQYPLLEAKEEVPLAQVLDRGRKAASMLDSERDWRALERRALNQASRQGSEAKDLFILTNLRLVVSLSKRYPQTPGMSRLDIIQEGSFGLQRAVEKFDWEKGFKFSTYATFWIKKYVQTALERRSSLIRVPGKKDLELRASMGETGDEANLVGNPDLWRLAMLTSPTSLERPFSAEDSKDLRDILPDTGINVEADALDAVQIEHITNLMDQLAPLEADILRLRFGIDGQEPANYKQIGIRYNQSTYWARKMCATSLTKLRKKLEQTPHSPTMHP